MKSSSIVKDLSIFLRYRALGGRLLVMNQSVPGYRQVEEAIVRYNEIAYQHWVNDEFLTWKWWLLLCLATVPWLIWWRVTDKRRTHEILLFGLFIALCSVCMDLIGTQLLLWGYPDKVSQLLPAQVESILLVPVLLGLICFRSVSYRKNPALA